MGLPMFSLRHLGPNGLVLVLRTHMAWEMGDRELAAVDASIPSRVQQLDDFVRLV